MHQNSSSENMNWATAATLLTLSVTTRCARDFKYYRTEDQVSIKRTDLIRACNRLLENSFTLQNLLMHDTPPSTWPFLFLTGRSINDGLEALHRDLLFFEADDIVDTIPLIDNERKSWSRYNLDSFYDQKLIGRLDHEIPVIFRKILSDVESLPEKS